MKKLFMLFICVFACLQPASAEGLTSNIKYALKHSTDGSYLSVVVALGVVILLIYITGIIYAKLNVVGYNTMKKQYLDLNDSKVLVLSNTVVGKDKSLLVVELSGKKMLLGVTEKSITLIKDLDETKPLNLENISKDVQKNPHLDRIYPTKDFMEDSDIEIKQNIPDEEKSEYDSEEFGLYKKYLD